MLVNREALQTLVERVGEFYVTDKTMKKAQERMRALLDSGNVEDAAVDAYLAVVRRYFSGFEREAREHLRSVDKRLEQINQVHFNLTAERSVAVTRIEKTQAVLGELAGLESIGAV